MIDTRIRPAEPFDLRGVLALLRGAALPQDVEPHFTTFLVAERGAPLEVRETREIREPCPVTARLMKLESG